MKNNKDDLIERVKKVKRYFKAKGVSRDQFFDDVFGPMYDSEHNRAVNLWFCKITDEEFTKCLERYAQFPRNYRTESAEYKRFIKFVDWYMKLGGHPLTPKQIEDVYEKFKNEN